MKHDDLVVITNIHGEEQEWRALWQGKPGHWWFKPVGRHGNKKQFNLDRVKEKANGAG